MKMLYENLLLFALLCVIIPHVHPKATFPVNTATFIKYILHLRFYPTSCDAAALLLLLVGTDFPYFCIYVSMYLHTSDIDVF